jgi:hypothetical protein
MKLVVSSDKDFKQLLLFKNTHLFDPMKDLFHQMSTSEVEEFKMLHTLIGDSGDDVPSIKAETEFTLEFLGFLKSKDIYLTDVKKFKELNISTKMIQDFAEERPECKVYKKANFAEKTAQKVMTSGVEEFLDQNPLYRENYERNQKLVLLENIPEDLQNKIQTEYMNSEVHHDSKHIMEYFLKHNLKEALENLNVFSFNDAKGLDSWFDAWEK